MKFYIFFTIIYSLKKINIQLRWINVKLISFVIRMDKIINEKRKEWSILILE